MNPLRTLRRLSAAIASTLVLGLLLTSCALAPGLGVLGGADPEPQRPSSITVHWLAVAGDTGATGTTVISRSAPETPGDFRVEFSENEVGGIGAQSQAGAWNAAIISTLLLGLPLEGAFRFETDGRIDGPSAGALTTAGLIALARGETFADGATMTGTINATGTIGPVGGIPEKIAAAADEGFTKVMIPMGQRMSADHAGELVDVVQLGEQEGVEVIEVGDIYEAYRGLTGSEIATPESTAEPRLDTVSYDKIKPQTDAALARYRSALDSFARQPAEIQLIFQQSGLLDAIDGYAQKAADLQRQGLQAGAYNLASQAAAFMEAVEATSAMTVPLYTQGLDGLSTIFEQALDTSVAQTEFTSFVDRLSTYEPKTVSDVEGLVNAYAGAFDAYSLLTFADSSLQTIQTKWQNDGYESLEAFFNELLMPVLWSQLSRSQIEMAEASFEVGRDNPGAEINAEVDLHQVGDFFRRGADANLTTFTETVVAPLAEARGVSDEQVIALLGNVDLNVATAVIQQQVQPAIEQYIGEDEANAAYATLGYGLSNYVRNQMLVDKYYNNAKLDDALNIVGANYDAVLGHALDLGKRQLSAEIEGLRETGTEPVISVAGYEVAGLLRNGSASDQFTAIAGYNGGFVTTRMMGYLIADRENGEEGTGES